MAVVIETTLGDITVDLFLQERPKACLNFLKLCKLKYYNFNLFHTIEHGFIAQTGDPTGVGDGGHSIWGVIEGKHKRFYKAEYIPKIRHSEPGLLSMVSLGDNLIGSQFFFTLGEDLTSLDGVHCVIGQITEGHEVLRKINEAICDAKHRPYQDIRITHTVILEDPFENPRGFQAPSRSPSPSAERLQGGRIGADENIDDTEGKTEQEVQEMLQEREAKARATILEIVGDLPDAEVAPPENVLFVCKLNPVTSDDDLEIIFSRFGRVKGCEVIRDRVTGDSLQYAFVEFEDSKTCESAYFKMDNVLIDDRRIHVDFSQSVAKVQWKGKGRGLIFKDGNKSNRLNFSDLKGRPGVPTMKRSNTNWQNNRQSNKDNRKSRSRSPLPRARSPDRHDKRTQSRNNDNRQRSRSPGRSNKNNHEYRDRSYNQHRSTDNSRYRQRSVSPSRQRNAERYEKSYRRDSPERKTSRRNSPNGRHRSRSPKNNRKNELEQRSSYRKEEFSKKSKKSKRRSSSTSSESSAKAKKHKKSKKSVKNKKKKSKKSKKAASSSSSSSSSDSSSS